VDLRVPKDVSDSRGVGGSLDFELGMVWGNERRQPEDDVDIRLRGRKLEDQERCFADRPDTRRLESRPTVPQ
jgi:hypothetical protein